MWQARNIAEHAYCPRLFYFMQVEGVQLPSTDTELGLAVHRRVDKPSADPAAATGEDDPCDEARPLVVRALTLSSEPLQLVAKLDLAEISGHVAVPVEYRKGRPRHIHTTSPGAELEEPDEARLTAPTPWPTDRVQVGLQVLLLEEAGYTVRRAVLYYAAEKRRIEIEADDLLRSEARNCLADAKRTAAGGTRPPPLANDARCARCSLQPVCLPDELNYLRAEAEEQSAPAPTPRRLWPPRAEGEHIVVQKYGSRVGVRGECLRVVDSEGALLKDVALAGVESVYLLGNVQISSQAVTTLAERGVPVAWLSPAGRLRALTDPLDSVSAAVRRAQVLQLEVAGVRLAMARALISAKITNQRTILMRNLKANADTGVDRAVAEMLHHAGALETARDLDMVRGHEGQAAALYFSHLPSAFKDAGLAAEFAGNGRDRRPPPDPINSCLSFAYAMLTHECVAALRMARLEPSLGGFHSSKTGRPAMALDLMEPFRPLISDSIALSAFNRGELAGGHFMRTAAGCVLTEAGRRAFFSAYDRRMNAEVTHPVFGYRLTYRRMIGLHARLLAAWFLGDVPELAFLTTR